MDLKNCDESNVTSNVTKLGTENYAIGNQKYATINFQVKIDIEQLV